MEVIRPLEDLERRYPLPWEGLGIQLLQSATMQRICCHEETLLHLNHERRIDNPYKAHNLRDLLENKSAPDFPHKSHDPHKNGAPLILSWTITKEIT